MNTLTFLKNIARFSTTALSPVRRMELQAIQSNMSRNAHTRRLVNNVLIGINCTNIALKYSKCYLCKLPLLNYFIRRLHNMQFVDQSVRSINQELFEQFPRDLGFLRTMGRYFQYQNKNLFSSFSLLFTEKVSPTQEMQMRKFLTAIESVTLGFELHYNVGTNYRPSTLVEIGLKVVQKVIKDKYLVLAGDYFHIRASVLGGESQNIEVSRLLADMEINLCKFVHLKEKLKDKIIQKGYGSIQIQEIYKVSKIKAKQVTQGLQGMDIIKGCLGAEAERRELYDCIGLLVVYRRDLEKFMFNFYSIVRKYLESRKRLPEQGVPRDELFCEEYTLTNYLFYQSAQQCERIDLAYLNTVQMMNTEIEYLLGRIRALLSEQNGAAGSGSQQYEALLKKINYILMVHPA